MILSLAQYSRQTVLREEVITQTEKTLDSSDVQILVMQSALDFGVELVVTRQVPPARLIFVFFNEFTKQQSWLRQFVKAKRRNSELATSKENEPIAFELVRRLHSEKRLSQR